MIVSVKMTILIKLIIKDEDTFLYERSLGLCHFKEYSDRYQAPDLPY